MLKSPDFDKGKIMNLLSFESNNLSMFKKIYGYRNGNNMANFCIVAHCNHSLHPGYKLVQVSTVCAYCFRVVRSLCKQLLY